MKYFDFILKQTIINNIWHQYAVQFKLLNLEHAFSLI
jgi:hypothetical protein